MSGYRIWLDPAGSDAHLFHIPCDRSLRCIETTLMKFLRDLRGSVDAETIIIYLPDSFHGFLLLDASVAWLPIDPVVVTAL